jgi:tetratricopeptide (TPR) repeat protein
VALLFPARDVAAVLALCARLGLDPFGRVYDVAGGFLVRLDEPTPRAFPGVVRLRSLARNLFLPVDADLVPALLDDEAEGLTRTRGLVILPGGRALGFDPAAPLVPAALLTGTARPLRGGGWQPLPARPTLAERIEEISVVLPNESPESVLDAGAGAIGTEEPRPDAAGPGATILGSATLGAGRGLTWLGKALGLDGLTRLGARWIGQAQQLAPRLSEAVLGRQDAALRALLREFREGNLERALRRALPLGEPGGPRGAMVDTRDQLPTQKTSYALRDLLGPPGRGRALVWSSGPDVLAELAGEYRKAAAQAIHAGDFRRAAFIYGKLLRDFRAAVNALQRGGLHHDAAVLLLARLGDPRGAARAFEDAGEFDRAIALYQELGDHVAAGDLLRRIGEEKAAVEHYRRAAELLAAREPDGRLAAGDLLRTKVGACDEVRRHYALGWDRRPERNAVSCGVRLLQLDIEAGDFAAVRNLLDEADACFARQGDLLLVGYFYNELADLANRAIASISASAGDAAAVREELRDRALCGLAREVRARAHPGALTAELVATLSRRGNTWPAAVISDADFAISAVTRTRSPRPAAEPPHGNDRSVQWLKAGRGVVTAFSAAPESGEVFLGFAEGDVLVVRPERGEVAQVADYQLTVAGLAASPDGRYLVSLRSNQSGPGVISSYERDSSGCYRNRLGTVLPVDGPVEPVLTPVLRRADGDRVGLLCGRELHILAMSSLTWEGSFAFPRDEHSPTPMLLVSWPGSDGEEGFAALAHDGHAWTLVDPDGDVIHQTSLRTRPCLPVNSPLRSVPASWMCASADHLEVAGVGQSGTLFWAAFDASDDCLQLIGMNTAIDPEQGGYLATAVVAPQLVAGVTRTRIDWLRSGNSRFTLRRSTRLTCPNAVACTASRQAGALVVIGADGRIAWVPIPV